MPRSGTTFLYHTFQKHPSIFVPFRKEIDYFTFNYYRGKCWYQQFYSGMQSNQLGCDISPSYFIDRSSLKRIKNFNRDVKVVLIVRDPVEFVVSWYRHLNTFVWDLPDFGTFMENYSLKIKKYQIHVELNNNFIVNMINNYREVFGDNLLLCSFDLLKRDPLSLLHSIESFIGIPPYFQHSNFDNMPINASGRGNIKLISYILSRGIVIKVISVLFPDKLILSMRNAFDRISIKGLSLKDNRNGLEHHVFAEETLVDQRLFVKKLFSDSDILRGSGDPFPMPKGS